MCLYSLIYTVISCFFFSSRRRHTRSKRDWSSDVCSSDLYQYWYQYITNDNDSQLKFQGHQKTSSKTTGAAISTRPVLFSPSFHIPPYRIPSQIPQYQLKTRS